MKKEERVAVRRCSRNRGGCRRLYNSCRVSEREEGKNNRVRMEGEVCNRARPGPGGKFLPTGISPTVGIVTVPFMIYWPFCLRLAPIRHGLFSVNAASSSYLPSSRGLAETTRGDCLVQGLSCSFVDKSESVKFGAEDVQPWPSLMVWCLRIHFLPSPYLGKMDRCSSHTSSIQPQMVRR
ncbi:uncharacterized protein BO97DRAFT_184298 [Aspergillus homomorphus CBS 101889]|uniref:Uncharacterized protein n=1 Tax=Aspergillus homomorphus (strain CBS 101889) TaxID=1450537 RepID=A0A395IAB7_ASPHC|nr:hypothetical protein BO97DRAFT_184298 [Aspergillus homomorphus CBS 101889]RAL16153.1 hypothetical protein BO97DRAFT_184298 [Aspergillus homomorphus CBS 101889]